ncbi:MAG: transcription termination/antitermination protein NusG [Isosphaeraceae bacterium]
MPILPAEPDLYPADLWNGGHDAAVAGRRWWCLHTKPRQEKATVRELHHQKVPYYLPMAVNESRTPQGRKIRSVVPLFPGYVFLLGDDRERVLSLRGNRVVRILNVPDQESLSHDLRQVHGMLASGLAVSPEPQMPVGAHVRILSGPLTGLEGIVIRRGKHDQFVALVRFLGSGATVDLEDWQVERLPEAN